MVKTTLALEIDLDCYAMEFVNSIYNPGYIVCTVSDACESAKLELPVEQFKDIVKMLSNFAVQLEDDENE